MDEAETPEFPPSSLSLLDATVAGQMIVNIHMHGAIQNTLAALEALDIAGVAKTHIKKAHRDLNQAHQELREIGDRYFQVEDDERS